MSNTTLRSEIGARPCRHEQGSVPPIDHPVGFVPAPFLGGDSRIATVPHPGLNKYFCPATPAPDPVFALSCTASPVSVQGFDRAVKAFAGIALEASSLPQHDQ